MKSGIILGRVQEAVNHVRLRGGLEVGSGRREVSGTADDVDRIKPLVLAILWDVVPIVLGGVTASKCEHIPELSGQPLEALHTPRLN